MLHRFYLNSACVQIDYSVICCLQEFENKKTSIATTEAL